MEGRPEQEVTLLIKNPTRTEAPFKLTVKLGSSLLDVQRAIQEQYDGNPAPAAQTLIHAGKVLKDAGVKLVDVLKQPIESSMPHSLHLVIKTQPTSGASSSGSSSMSPAAAAVAAAASRAAAAQRSTNSSTPASTSIPTSSTTPAPTPVTVPAPAPAPTVVSPAQQQQQQHKPAPSSAGAQVQPADAAIAAAAAAPMAAPVPTTTAGAATSNTAPQQAAAAATPAPGAYPLVMVNPVVAAAYQAAYAAALATTAHLNQLQQAGGTTPSTSGSNMPMMMPMAAPFPMLYPPGAQPGMPAPGVWMQPMQHAPGMPVPMQWQAAAAAAAGDEQGARLQLARGQQQLEQALRRADMALPRPRRVQMITLRINIRNVLQVLVFAIVFWQHFTMQRLLILLAILAAMFLFASANALQRMIAALAGQGRPRAEDQPGGAAAPGPAGAGAADAAAGPPGRPGFLREVALLLVGFFTSLLPTWNYNPEDAAAFAIAQEMMAREMQQQGQEQQGAAEGEGEGAAGAHAHQD